MKKLIVALIFLLLSLPCLAHDYLSQEFINKINKHLDSSYAKGMSSSRIYEAAANQLANKAIELNDKKFLDYINHMRLKSYPKDFGWGHTGKGMEIIRAASKKIDYANQKREEGIHIKKLRKLELEIRKNEIRKNTVVEGNLAIDKNSKKFQTIIVPSGIIGEISEARIKILDKTLESKLDDYFAIVPKELFEKAQEKVFQEMDADECTVDQCIMIIKGILQIENVFKMDLISEDGDTQISVTWNDQDQKRVVEDYCEGCKTKELRLMIIGLVEKLVGNQVVEKPVVVVKNKGKGVLYKRYVNYKFGWYKHGDEKEDGKYVGNIKDGKPIGQGTLTYSNGGKYVGGWKNGKENGQGTWNLPDGTKEVGEWKDGLMWNGTNYSVEGFIFFRVVNGKRIKR